MISLWLKLALAAAALSAAAGVYWWIYDAGGDAERDKIQIEELRAGAEERQRAKEIGNRMRELDDDALFDRNRVP